MGIRTALATGGLILLTSCASNVKKKVEAPKPRPVPDYVCSFSEPEYGFRKGLKVSLAGESYSIVLYRRSFEDTATFRYLKDGRSSLTVFLKGQDKVTISTNEKGVVMKYGNFTQGTHCQFDDSGAGYGLSELCDKKGLHAQVTKMFKGFKAKLGVHYHHPTWIEMNRKHEERLREKATFGDNSEEKKPEGATLVVFYRPDGFVVKKGSWFRREGKEDHVWDYFAFEESVKPRKACTWFTDENSHKVSYCDTDGDGKFDSFEVQTSNQVKSCKFTAKGRKTKRFRHQKGEFDAWKKELTPGKFKGYWQDLKKHFK